MSAVAPYRSNKGSGLTKKVDYPSFGGVGGPAATDTAVSSVTKTSAARVCAQNSCVFPPQMGDKTLAQSAQMYHYQHRKQQMLAVGQ